MPTLSERATQKPTPICKYPKRPNSSSHKTAGLEFWHTATSRDIYRCFVFDKVESCEVSECQEQSAV